ncbi:MAG: D-alanyl-D-alanine carboxypeptidase [Eubacteriaceae bacterium]|nr:D-alanyl-D-alanine carboxypeptidase [Eubacteriaceae bacterium]
MRKLHIALICAFLINAAFATPVGASSRAHVVIEQKTKAILYENNAHERLPMASTTKIATAIVAIESGKLNETVTVSSRAAGVSGSSLYLKAGDTIQLGELIAATLFVSANDGTVAIAEHIDGTMEKFVDRMNAYVKKLGLENTNFANPHGLTAENHYSTAYDLAYIMATAIENETFLKMVSSQTWSVTINGETKMYLNKDQFLYLYEYSIGGKTGLTSAAGRCFVSASEQNGLTLCSTVLNSSNIYNESINLMNTAFSEYKLSCAVRKGEYIATVPIEGGRQSELKLKFIDDIYVPTKKSEPDDFKVEAYYEEYLQAPIAKNQIIGKYYIISGQNVLIEGNIQSPRRVVAKEPFVQGFLKWYRYLLELAV